MLKNLMKVLKYLDFSTLSNNLKLRQYCEVQGRIKRTLIMPDDCKTRIVCGALKHCSSETFQGDVDTHIHVHIYNCMHSVFTPMTLNITM